MKRFMSLCLTAVLATGVLAACGTGAKDVYEKTGTPDAGTPAEPVTLRIGQLPIIDGLPFWIAEQENLYKNAGVNVELIKFSSANERDAAIQSGDIDGMLADLIATTTLYASGTEVQIASLSLGATPEEGPIAIVAGKDSGITKVEDLKGVEIAVSTNSMIHYVAEQLLLENGIKPEEIQLVSIPMIPTRLEMLLSGGVKAAVLPEPALSLALNGGAKVIAVDAKAKQNYSQSVTVFTKKAIDEKADGIKRFFKAYNQAVGMTQINPTGYNELLAAKANLPATLKETFQHGPFPAAQAPLKQDVERVVKWLSDKKLIQSTPTYEQLVNDTLLP